MKTIKLVLAIIGPLFTRITAKWLVFALVIFVIFCFFYDRMFSIYLPDHRTWYAIGILSLCMVAPATGFFFLPHFFRERALFQSADNPSLIDGKRVAVHGKLESTEQPILTPFTKKPCLYYEYTIYWYRHLSSIQQSPGRTTETINDFAGFAGIPYVLQSSTGRFHLQGIPPSETLSGKITKAIAAAAINQYIKETVFEERNDSLIFLPAAERRIIAGRQ